MSLITNTVFPVAGLGSRFLPAIAANPNGYLKTPRAYGLAHLEVGGEIAVHPDNLARMRAGPRARAQSPAVA